MLVDQAMLKASQHDDLNDTELLNEFCQLAVQNNSTNVLMHLIKQGASVKTLRPRDVAWGETRSKAILEIMLVHGWEINARDDSRGDPNDEPFMWSVLRDIELVSWCLEHGASVFPRGQEPLRDDIITMSQRKCQQILEKAAYSATVTTFELLRSQGAPLGWRPLHRAVETAALYQAYPGEDANRGEEEEKDAKDSARNYEERMAMVRHLVDVVGIDVNAPDQPPDGKVPDRWGTPICYVTKSYGIKTDTRELVWFLLDRGADPTPALDDAKHVKHDTFAADVEAWSAQQRGGRKCCTIQ